MYLTFIYFQGTRSQGLPPVSDVKEEENFVTFSSGFLGQNIFLSLKGTSLILTKSVLVGQTVIRRRTFDDFRIFCYSGRYQNRQLSAKLKLQRNIRFGKLKMFAIVFQKILEIYSRIQSFSQRHADQRSLLTLICIHHYHNKTATRLLLTTVIATCDFIGNLVLGGPIVFCHSPDPHVKCCQKAILFDVQKNY